MKANILQKLIGKENIRKYNKTLVNLSSFNIKEDVDMTKRAKVLTLDEFKKAINYCATTRYQLRNSCLLMMSFYGGLRVGEISALQYKDVIDSDGLVKTEFYLTADKTKGDEGRNIYVNKIVTSCDEIISLTNPIFVGSSVEIGEICNSISNEMKESIKLSNDKINILHLGENLIQWIMKTDIVLQIKILRLRQLWCQSIERVMSAQNIPHPYEDILQQFQNLAVTVLSKISHSSDKLRFTLSSVYAVLQPMITGPN